MTRAPELWGGVECTVNRVGDQYFDQLDRSGHNLRLDDIDRFAELGITAIRFPLLWERTAPARIEDADWSWADTRLERLRQLGIRPIVGLVHHGSGPPHTSLVDPHFASGLAEFAAAVARRYPWIEDFTPVNEPLTTARFSCLYGLWYPHARSTPAFIRAVAIQCRATVESMRRIRDVIPSARLIQTEDGGAVASTPALAYQAEYENHRRWLSLDLLAGRVTPSHPLYEHLLEAGLPVRDLDYFQANTCLPDIVGINYYVLSDRFLDEHIQHYPPALHGGNGRDRYADAEAVRCGEHPEAFRGHAAALRDAWNRYHQPVALTEVHLDSTREDQLRWVNEAWNAGQAVAREGVDMRAVTLWGLLGLFDWNTLLVRQNGYYESGVFDVRGTRPRATALARFARSLTRGEAFRHAVLASPGWWRRPERIRPREGARRLATSGNGHTARPVVIAGAGGTLGSALVRVAALRGIASAAVTRSEFDISDPATVAGYLDRVRPWAVLNAAGFVDVDGAEQQIERCRRENLAGPVTLAAACRDRGIRLVTFSSDLVFDGTSRRPYVESDQPSPLSVYGTAKAEAENAVLQTQPDALIIRTSAFFGPWDEFNVLTRALRAIARGNPVHAVGDLMVSPTYVPDLANATLDLLVDEESGIWHLANTGAISWLSLLRRGAELAGLDPDLVNACEPPAIGWLAPRPAYSVLGSERAPLLPTLEDSLARYLRDMDVTVHHQPGVSSTSAREAGPG